MNYKRMDHKFKTQQVFSEVFRALTKSKDVLPVPVICGSSPAHWVTAAERKTRLSSKHDGNDNAIITANHKYRCQSASSETQSKLQMVECEWSLMAEPLFTCDTHLQLPCESFYKELTHRRGSRYGTRHVLPVNSSVYTQSPPSMLRCLPHEPLTSIKFGQSCDTTKVSREQNEAHQSDLPPGGAESSYPRLNVWMRASR